MRVLLKCRSQLLHALVTHVWNTVVGAGPYPGHCPPSRIKLREVLYTLTTLLGFSHSQAVLSYCWRDSCNHTGMCPRHSAHQCGCLQIARHL